MSQLEPDAPATVAVFVPRGGETWRNPFTMYAALRDHDPVHHVPDPTGGDADYWVISRFRHVFDAARDTATFSSADGLTFTYGEREKAGLDADAVPIVMMDPPEHTRFRRLVAGGFTPRRVAAIEPMVRDFVAGRIEGLRAAGSGDIVAEVFKPLPSLVVAHYLGVPEADRARFDAWTEAIVAISAGVADPTAPDATAPDATAPDATAPDATAPDATAPDAIAELIGYFAELIERRRVEPGDDMVSMLVGAESAGAESAGVMVDLVQILGFAFTMVAGGNDTTTGLLGGAAELLTRHPDQRRLLLDDPTAIPHAVEEFLRLTSPVQGLARTATRDVELEGRTIPAGRKALLLYASANRDPREFGPSAEECDLSRPIDKMMSFSYGAHHCLGAAAARLQGRVALEELLARCPGFAVDGDAGQFAPGNFVRRYASLPFTADGGV